MTIPPTKRETHLDRGAWLMLAFVIGFVVAVLATTAYVLAIPGDGWQMPYETGPQPWPLENFMGDWSTPLRVGDKVTAVDGIIVARDYDSIGPLNPPPDWIDGGTALYSIERDGQSAEVSVSLHTLDLAGTWRGFWHAMQDAPAEWSWSLIAIANPDEFTLGRQDRTDVNSKCCIETVAF